MSVAFLQRYRTSVRCKSILGLCPFRVQSTNTQFGPHVVCDARHTVYTAFFTLFIFISYLTLFPDIVKSPRFAMLSNTMFTIVLLEHSIIIGVFPCLLFASWHNRRQHAQLLNAIAQIYDRMCAQAGQPIGHLSRRSALHFIWIAYQVIGSFVPLGSVLGDYRVPVGDKIYYILFYVGILTMIVFVTHVHDMVQLLNEVHSGARLAERITCMHFHEIQEIIEQLEPCFGTQLFLCIAKDFVVLTTVAFFLVLDTSKPVRGQKLYFFAMYAVPAFVHGVFISQSFGRLENEVAGMQRAIGRQTSDSDAEVGKPIMQRTN